MTRSLDKLPKEESQKILCFYGNTTCKMQIARISNPENKYWERIVFPGERFLFEAVSETELEIYQTQENGDMKCEYFLCKGLKVDE
ncbi:MAG: DUF1830 domain-containing protein [Trichodesmium sp. MAG_R03]|nr:DUF1830 domain-containing protein [Trichodesmium sp. MAG_R03]